MKRRQGWLAGLLLAAVLVRAGAVLALKSHLVPRSTYEHGEIAASLVAGRGFSMHFLGADGPTSQQAPIYPFIVALAYWIGGVEQPRALLLLELGQAALGALMVLGVFRLTSRLAPQRPALPWAAAVVAAFHPTLVYAATHVQVALLAATLLVWTLDAAMRAGASGSTRDGCTAALLLALCALSDPILALGGSGVAAAIAMTSSASPLRRRLVQIGVVAAVAGAGILPWVVRNALVHGEFVPIKSTFGYAFWQGNCAISEGTDKVVRASVEDVMEEAGAASGLASFNRTIWKARHTAGYIDDVAFTKEDRRYLGSLSEPARSRVLFQRAVEDIRRDPGRYACLCLRRLRYFWLFDETNPRSRVLLYRISHLGLTALAIAGLAIGGPAFRRRSAPMLVTVAAISLFHALTIVSARFHIPIEPLMAVWAGAGIVGLGDLAVRAARRRSVTAAGRLEHVGIISRLG